jgi:hypothetical protein
MKSHHTEKGTTFQSIRHRPGEHPHAAESKTPERAVEASQRAAKSSAMPDEFYKGDFKNSPAHEAEGRIGTQTPGGSEAAHAPVQRDRGRESTAESEQQAREHTGAPLK